MVKYEILSPLQLIRLISNSVRRRERELLPVFMAYIFPFTESLFRLPPLERTAEFDLQQAVANAKIQSTIEEDEYADLLTFRAGPCEYANNASVGSSSVVTASKQRRPPKLDGWDKIWIEYHPPWPMPLLFTPQLLER